jgi:hypothetical protein
MLEPYNSFKDRRGRTRQHEQDLLRNSWKQPYLYESDGKSYRLISPGRRGYLIGRVYSWRETDGPSRSDTSLIFANGEPAELVVPVSQSRP